MRKLIATTAVLAAAGGGVATTAQASSYTRARAAVCYYFGPQCNTAMSIVNCETGGTYSPYAQNGQYLGIFQMGSWARSTFGHGWNVWVQARAAYRYYRSSGWGPWECAHILGIA